MKHCDVKGCVIGLFSVQLWTADCFPLRQGKRHNQFVFLPNIYEESRGPDFCIKYIISDF